MKATKKTVAKKAAPKRAPAARPSKVIESRHMSELSPKDRQYLEELLRIEAKMITPGEKAHLQARAAYLTSDERKKYGI